MDFQLIDIFQLHQRPPGKWYMTINPNLYSPLNDDWKILYQKIQREGYKNGINSTHENKEFQ